MFATLPLFLEAHVFVRLYVCMGVEKRALQRPHVSRQAKMINKGKRQI